MKMHRRLEKLNKNYFDEFCRTTMRVGFVQDSEEKIMLFVEGLKLSIKRNICVDNMQSLE